MTGKVDGRNMKILKQGEYTATVVREKDIDGAVVVNSLSTTESFTGWHSHENLHFCFVYEGRSDTCRQSSYADKRGDVFFYHAGEAHRWVSPSLLSKSANIELSRDFLAKYNLNETSVHAALKNKARVLPLMIKIQSELMLGSSDSHSSLLQLLLELLSSTPVAVPHPTWVGKIDEVLNDMWNEWISLEQVSEMTGLHVVTISRSFRNYFGCTFGEYRRRLKIERSLSLIKETRMSLTEIANFCGFSDQSHFSRIFKGMTGMSPRRYREF